MSKLFGCNRKLKKEGGICNSCGQRVDKILQKETMQGLEYICQHCAKLDVKAFKPKEPRRVPVLDKV